MTVLDQVSSGVGVSDLDALSDDELLECYAGLRRDANRIEAEALRVLAAIEQRGAHEQEGFLSASSWAIHRCREAEGRAHLRARVARRLRQMPATAGSFAAGELDFDRVRALVEARETSPRLFARDEQVLLDAARSLPMRRLRSVIDYWRQAADEAAVERDAEAAHRRRRLHVSPLWDGMVRLDGELDREGGEMVLAALASLADPAGLDPGDARSPAQHRADALVDLCREHLDRGEAPASGGERPHLTVMVDLAVLEGRTGRPCELEEGGVITGEAARRLACDAAVSRVITRGPGEVLDVGRRTRTVPAATRRALVVRDGGCGFPGCDRPPRWCDAHHIRHWAQGGGTDLANLILLCRRHHRMVHEGRAAVPRRQ